MSDPVVCPACQKALPESVVKGPAQAVVRCEQCATLLLWSHGKVVRSARSSNPSTLQGMPVQKPPSPVASPRPAAPKATLMGISAPPPRPEPPKVAASSPPKKPEKPQIAASIAQPQKAMPGPMENPSAWFDDPSALTEDDDEPTKVGAEPEALPPLEPAKPELPAQKTMMAATPPQPKTVMAPAPAQPKTVTAPAQPKTVMAPAQPKTVMAPAPAQPKTVMAPAPAQQKTVSAPAPLFAKAEPKVEPPKVEAPKIEAPKIEPKVEAPKIEPKIEAPKIEEPRAAIPTPTPLGGVMEPMLDLSTDRRRPPILYAAIAAGGAMVLVLVVVLAFRGGSKPPVKTAEPPPPKPAVVEKAPEPPPKPAVAEKAPEPPPVAAPPVVEKRKAEPSFESAVAEPPAPRHRSRTLGGKKVVLEDDKSAPVEPKEDPAQVERAREAYKRGNEKLFSGNSAGAIDAYKESLSIYPGYVAGYRGLGLAYAQEGNNADALKALKTYVKNAPTAHDVPLIMKRIERLEKSPQD